MPIIIRGFTGLKPKLDPELIEQNEAQIASDIRLLNGNLEPLKLPVNVAVSSVANPQTIYRFDQDYALDDNYWFAFPTDYDVVRGAVVDDSTERTFYTGGTAPQQTNRPLALAGTPYPNQSYLLGVPAPTTAPLVSVSGAPTNPADPLYSAAYIVTYVTGFGEEGAAGLPSNIVSYQPGQSLDISGLPIAPVGAYNITAIRIYRSASTTTSSAYRFVVELPIGTASYSDMATDTSLGEEIQTTDYLPPPTDMIGLCLMANGIYAGFKKNARTLYFSPPFVPYAYPIRYQLAVDDVIVGIKPFGQSLFVGTKAHPYIITGADPEYLTQTKYPMNQACSSKRSMVVVSGGVLYASPDGVVQATESGLSVVTEGLLSREQWQSYKPESMHCYEINGQYIVFYDNGTTRGSLLFDFSGKEAIMRTSTIWCSSAYSDRLRDALFIANGTNIQRFDSGAAMPFTYRSKRYRSTYRRGYSRLKIEAAAYPVTANLYVDNVLFYNVVVNSRQPVPIPSGQGELWEIEVVSTNSIKVITLSDALPEF